MKKVKLYAMAFAALFFAASCQDDAIDSGQGSGNGGKGTPAYLTVSFTANSESSTRAADDQNTGDQDGSVEDSGHETVGTSDEYAVKTALIVVVPQDDAAEGAGYAQLYTVSGDNANMGSSQKDDAELIITGPNSAKTYSTEGPIEIEATETGITYKVLVVVNPASTLTDDLTTAVTDVNVARALYDDIVMGNFADVSESSTYVSAATELGSSDKGFMMANQKEETITVTTANIESNPATLDEPIKVERVLSKITFRRGTEENNGKDLIYKMETSLGTKYSAKTERGAYDASALTAGADAAVAALADAEAATPDYQLGTFNEAQDLLGKTVYVLFAEGAEGKMEYKGVFRKTTETVLSTTTSSSMTRTGETTTVEGQTIFKLMTPVTQEQWEAGKLDLEETPAAQTRPATEPADGTDPKIGWFVVNDNYDGTDNAISEEDILGSIEYVLDPATGQEAQTEVYVKLEGYALINLSKSVNYVRHTTTDVLASMGAPFGTLSDNNTYLWTPYWQEKNSVTFDADDNFVGSPAVGTWFYNTLADVSAESKNMTVSSGQVSFTNLNYFKAMPGTDDGHDTTVSGGGTQHSNTLPNVGNLLGYCFENSVAKDQQVRGLTTGISFVATIWKDQSCSQSIEILYRHMGKLYTSLKDMNDAYHGLKEAIADLAEKEIKGDEITKEDLEAAGVERYQSNICYYYTTEIKHWDNSKDDEMGIMEFAIMRNNIYSLAVTKISDIGNPFVDPTPGTEDETPQAYMTVEAEIVPWIVRYNDIEF